MSDFSQQHLPLTREKLLLRNDPVDLGVESFKLKTDPKLIETLLLSRENIIL